MIAETRVSPLFVREREEVADYALSWALEDATATGARDSGDGLAASA